MIEETRLLTLHAAHALDTAGSRAARKQVRRSRGKNRSSESVLHSPLLFFLDRHDQGRRGEDGVQGHRLRHTGVRRCGGVRRRPAGTDVSPTPLNRGNQVRMAFKSTLFGRYSYARTLRIADGPDEVHLSSIAHLELRDQLKKAQAKL